MQWTYRFRLSDRYILMSLMVDLLRGQVIQDVLVDSEVVYIMLNNGTQITIKGVVVVEPKLSNRRPVSDVAQNAIVQRDVSI
jgi:hypothetical protein